jgi:polyhydroxybutyrate depolymerase
MIAFRHYLACSAWIPLAILFTSPATAGGWREASITVDGIERWYRVYLPDALPRKSPLLLSLHGGGGDMHTIDNGPTHGWVRQANKHKFLMVVPNASNKSGDTRGNRQNWNDLRSSADSQSDADDVGFINALLDRVEADYETSASSVYVTGVSNGGLMTYRLLIEAPSRFAAAAVFVANIPVDPTRLRPSAHPVPLLIWSGSDDRLMKYEGGEIPGKRGMMRSTPDNVAWWVMANRADGAEIQSEMLPDISNDGCRVRRTFYPALSNGAPVLFYLAEGGGHQMPSQTEKDSEGGPFFRMLVGRVCRDVDGADIAWEFMRHFKSREVASTTWRSSGTPAGKPAGAP